MSPKDPPPDVAGARSPDADVALVAEISLDGTLLDANERLCRLLGRPREQLVGQCFWSGMPPYSAARMRQVFLAAVSDSSLPTEIETPLVAGDGTRHVILWRPVWHRSDTGACRGIIAVGLDISELIHVRQVVREQVQILEVFFEHLHTPVALLDAEFRFVRVNKAYVADTGRPADELIGRNHFDLYPSEEAEAIFRQVLETGVPYRTHARPFEYPDHPERGVTYWDWSLARVEGPKTPVALILSLQDVTERVLAEHRLAEQQQSLRRLVQRQSSVLRYERQRVATAIHDNLGQLLDLAKIRTEQAAAGLSDGGPAELLGEIRRLLEESSDFATDLTFQLSPPILRRLGLVAALGWLGDQMQARHGLRVDVSGDESAHALTDETMDMLYGAIRELLMNVVKHAGVSTAAVEFTMTPDAAIVTVEDDGHGFDTVLASRARTEAQSFGLFAVEEGVHYAGGSATIHSEPGQGTRVTLTIPLRGNTDAMGDAP